MSQALKEHAIKQKYGAPDWFEPSFAPFFNDLTEAETATLKLELQETAKRAMERNKLDKPVI